MPANTGNQTVTILFNQPANSGVVNKRNVNIKSIGIYSGGYVTFAGAVATISPLICEITDGTYQVRVQTADAVNLTMSSATPYIVLRWAYVGTTSDYMEILQKAAADIEANDLIVGKCTFSGSNISGVLYNATDTYYAARGTLYYRSTPNDSDINLKVEAIASSMAVRVRAGRILFQGKSVYVPDQVTSAFTAHATQTKVGLVYITATGTIATINDLAGDGVVPNYGGKLVLAEIRIPPTTTAITQAMIHDCRNTAMFSKAPEKYYSDSAPTTRLDGTNFDSTDVGTVYINTTTKEMQVLSSADGAGTNVWTSMPIVYSSDFTPNPYAGQQSITWPNGLIEKTGIVSTPSGGSDPTVITFSEPFPTAVTCIQITQISTSGVVTYNLVADAVTKTGFTVRGQLTYSYCKGFYWCAKGY